MSTRLPVTTNGIPRLRTELRIVGENARPASYWAWLVVIALASLVLQGESLRLGVERLSADESARSLLARGLTWANLLEPFIWPPFTKVLVGVALKLHDDIFLVPRLLSNTAGLLTLFAVARLGRAAFRDLRVPLLAAAMAAVLPFRLLFSVAPMSDIYAALFLLLAAAPALRWLRGEAGAGALPGACAWVMLAETVRYEAVIFALCLGLVVLWRWWRTETGFGTLLGAALLLGGFPAFWVLDSLAWYGSLENLGLAGRQYRGLLGEDRLFALVWQPLGRPLLLELVFNPASLLGFAALGAALRRERALRAWAFAFWLPLPLVSVMMLATLSLPLAVIWRSFGTWSLLLLPWSAQALLLLAAAARERLGPSLRRLPVLPVLVAAALVLPATRSAWLAWRDGRMNDETGHLRQDRRVGLALRAALEGKGGHILIDSWDNLDFLDVITGSGAPDLFVTSAAADPVLVANDLPMRALLLRQHDEAALEGTLSDHFNLSRGGDPVALRQQDIRLLLVRAPRFRRALDGSPLVERLPRGWADWALYRVLPRAESRPG